jgi:hypothetical protein
MSPWTILAGVLLLGAVGSGGYWWGDHNATNAGEAKIEAMKASDAQALANSEAKARAQEQAAEQAQAAVQATYEKDKANAKAQYDSDVAALRNHTLQLRSEWSCTPQLATAVQSAAASRSNADAAEQQRERDAANIVRIASDDDTKIASLQAIVTSDRQ